MRRSRRIGLFASGLALLAAGTVIVADRVVAAEDARTASVAEVGRAPVAIVFGAGLHPDRTPSAVLEDRLLTALELYRSGKVKKLLVSGDHGQKGYDEPGTMAAFLEARGVPAGDIFLDHAGFDTWSTLYRAREVFAVRRALLVSQRFHLARALYDARKLGLDATGVRADRRSYQLESWFALRESAARMKAVLVAWLGLRPRFLGPRFPIEGDGSGTRD